MAKTPRFAGLLARVRSQGDDDEDETMSAEGQADDETAAEDEDDMEAAGQDGGDGKDEDDDTTPAANDGDDDETSDSAKAARRRERARIGRILNSEAAKGRQGLAIELAVGTDLSSKKAVALLAKSAKEPARQSRLDKAMAAIKQPKVGPGGSLDRKSALSAAVQDRNRRRQGRSAKPA